MVQLIEEQGREELSTAQRSAWMARLCSVDHAHNVPPYLGGSGFELLEFHKGSLIGLNKFKCNRSASAHLVRKENVIHQLPTERKPGFCYFRDMEFFTVDMLIAFGSLCFLEIVLGIDNIIFISLLTNQLEEERRPMARTAGIALALVLRVGMLFGISYIIGLTQPLLEVSSWQLTGRDLILFAGGVFLIWKSTSEIHHKVTGNGHEEEEQEHRSFWATIVQIGLIDLVFSFDSILTAIGMTDELPIMIAAVIVSLMVMLAFAGRISAFMEKRPTLQVLALSFLILIGTVLLAEATGLHVPKGYIYFALAFSLGVELLNLRMRARRRRRANR